MGLLDRLVAIWKQEHPEETLALPVSTGMDRRRFLQALGASAAVAAAAPMLDLEALVWTPGQQVAVAAETGVVTLDWITREALRVLKQNLEMITAHDRMMAGMAVGDTIRVRLPSRQVGVDMDMETFPTMGRARARRVYLEPSMAYTAQRIVDAGHVLSGDAFEMPRGVEQVSLAADGLGNGLRGCYGYNARSGKMVLRLDVHTRPA